MIGPRTGRIEVDGAAVLLGQSISADDDGAARATVKEGCLDWGKSDDVVAKRKNDAAMAEGVDEAMTIPSDEEDSRDNLETSAAATQDSMMVVGDTTIMATSTCATLPAGFMRRRLRLSGGRAAAEKQRHRRTDTQLAAVHGLLAAELRERREERAKVLRTQVRRLIAGVSGSSTLVPVQDRQRRVKEVVAALRDTVTRVAAEDAELRSVETNDTGPVQEASPATLESSDQWQLEQIYDEKVPKWLEERGSLQDMRRVRREAMKEAKKFRAFKRVQRLEQLRRGGQLRSKKPTAEKARMASKSVRKQKQQYQYVQQGNYGDVELVASEGGTKQRVAQLRAVGDGRMRSLPTALLAVSKTCILEAKLDTCAQFSVAGVELRRYGRCISRKAPVDVVEGFGGGRLRVLGVWQFSGTTQYQQRVIVNALLVDGQGSEFLIGEDWMMEHQVKMDFEKGELKYRDGCGLKVILPFTCNNLELPTKGERSIAVRMAKTVKLENNTVRVLKLRVCSEEGTTGVFIPKPTAKRHLMMAPTVSTVQDGEICVAAMNVEGRREKLPARSALGTWIPTDDTMQLLEMNGELERARVVEWVAKLRRRNAEPLQDEDKLEIGEMEQADKDLVITLLRQFPEIVNKKAGCPPLATTNVQHHINTGSADPIMLRRRRHAVAENAVIDKEVDEMLEQGVIEEGQGAWGFPVVLVKKKDGSVRFCVDYRALNAITVKDVYPLPRVDETLEALCGSRRFTSLDLHAGYWQLAVAPDDKVKTAFTTRRGLFQFTRMPFGLCNAPSTFQRLMDCVLRGITWVSCLVYLDDVVIFTKGSVARHVVELAAVLERLSNAGLSLKVSKCSFATTQMEYLGHDLTPDGIKPTERLVKAVKDFPTPTEEAEVRRFVALAGYYRRFMPEFGTKMAPLTKLLRKVIPWEWGAEQEEAFAWAKAWLSTKPVLIYSNYALPFKLTTDASKTGLGAVLSQDQGHGDQPVAYASKVNSPAEANYSISELECLAVVWAVRLFRPHLYGRRFTIVTDHIALKWLMTATEPAGRLHRWALTLQEYDFKIEYRPGHENRVADALSRNPVKNSGQQPGTECDAAEELAIGPGDKKNSNVSGRKRKRAVSMVRQSRGVAEALKDDISCGSSDELAAKIDQETRAAFIRRVEASELGIVQFTDADIKEEQQKSVMVQTLLEKGMYRGLEVYTKDDGLVYVKLAADEERIVLPVVFWALAFKEAHDSIWAGHLRGPQTLERVRRMYWWPQQREAVRDWVAACQDCGSRKARPKVVVPPLRSVRTGDVCDRWAIDVAGPLPETVHGNRYVVAAVEYTTRYAVAVAVPQHQAKEIAQFLMERVVLVFGPMREIMMDGAREFVSKATVELLELLQTRQATPVPYRPNLLGLVERFHRTWKDIISLYVDEQQDDWDDFLPCALYAYNSSPHATHGYQPNELMFGRKLRSPAELLRRSRLVHPGQSLESYHEMLLGDLKTAQQLAAVALQKEQARQAMYYNRRNAKKHAPFRTNQLVWVYRPARGKNITKFAHRWRGPGQVVTAAGYDNYLVKMLESGRELITHCSFLVPFYYPTHLLDQMAEDIAVDLRDEAIAAADTDSEGEESAENEGFSPAEEQAEVAVPAKLDATEGTSDAAVGTTTTPTRTEDGRKRRRTAERRVSAEGEAKTEDDEVPEPIRELRIRKRPTRLKQRPGVEELDHIASRTRARLRQAPYRSTDNTPTRNVSPSRALAPGTALAARPEPVVPNTTVQIQEGQDVAGSERSQAETNADEEKPVIYVFAVQGRRGVDSLVSNKPRIPQIRPKEKVIECRRRRYRTRTGRYAMEFEVQLVEGPSRDERGVKLWINQTDYEQLWREGRIKNNRSDTDSEDDAGDDLSNRGAEEAVAKAIQAVDDARLHTVGVADDPETRGRE